MNRTRNFYSIAVVILMTFWAYYSDYSFETFKVRDAVLLLLSAFLFIGIIFIFWIQKEYFPDSLKDSECSKIKKELEGKIKLLEDRIKSLEDKEINETQANHTNPSRGE